MGHEQGGRRPALVISSDQFNMVPHGLCIVVPMTTVNRGIASHIQVEPPEGGLSTPSVLMCEQAKSISVLRCRKRRGAMMPEIVQTAQALVGLFLDLDVTRSLPEATK
jgi:mRNA interferase MazF